MNESPGLAPDHLQRIYENRFPEADRHAKAAIWKVLVERFFQRWISPQDTVLDLGCGFGEFLGAVKARRRLGVDLNPASRQDLPEGIEVHGGSVCELGFLDQGSVDLVFTSNLMEHLPDKEAVDQMLGESLRVLRPGGIFLALGPNLRFLPGEYWDFWDHVVPITDRSLVEALELQGFSIERCWPKFLPYTTRSSLPQHPALVRAYLAFPLVWKVLGRQFLVAARKPR